MAGLIDETKEKMPAFWVLADLLASVVTGYAVVMALFMREKTGEGQFIDSSMYDSLVALNPIPLMIF